MAYRHRAHMEHWGLLHSAYCITSIDCCVSGAQMELRELDDHAIAQIKRVVVLEGTWHSAPLMAGTSSAARLPSLLRRDWTRL